MLYSKIHVYAISCRPEKYGKFWLEQIIPTPQFSRLHFWESHYFFRSYIRSPAQTWRRAALKRFNSYRSSADDYYPIERVGFFARFCNNVGEIEREFSRCSSLFSRREFRGNCRRDIFSSAMTSRGRWIIRLSDAAPWLADGGESRWDLLVGRAMTGRKKSTEET